jgi:hypothetical protein
MRAIDCALSYRRSRTVRSRKNRFLYLPPLGHPGIAGMALDHFYRHGQTAFPESAQSENANQECHVSSR